MDPQVPTRRGDVLILWTHNKTLSIHAVGAIAEDGQQDFNGQPPQVKYAADRNVAVAEAKALVAPGQRIFLRNLDTDEWSVIAAGASS